MYIQNNIYKNYSEIFISTYLSFIEKELDEHLKEHLKGTPVHI